MATETTYRPAGFATPKIGASVLYDHQTTGKWFAVAGEDGKILASGLTKKEAIKAAADYNRGQA